MTIDTESRTRTTDNDDVLDSVEVEASAVDTERPEPGPDAETGSAETGSAETGSAETDTESGTDTESEPARVSWRARALAYTIDMAGPAAILAVLALTFADDSGSRWARIACGVAVAAVIGFIGWNSVYRQGTTGRTLGKLTVGLRTTRCDTSRAPGILRAVWREAARIVDTAPALLGWFWPLRDGRGQTFSDKIAGTVVVADEASETGTRRQARTAAVGVLVALVAALGGLAAVQYVHDYRSDDATAAIASRAQDIAKDSTIALLSYQAATVDKDLAGASAKLTGSFKDYYNDYTKNVVIPAAKEKAVNTRAESVGTALVSADDRHATVLVFLNQTTTTADNPQPSQLASTVRVQLTEVGHEWLISGFDPI
ncbi:RDD family protein [Nocardia aobensis]|uniref:RDD family protein n=1 Tax=Nocardia aobensis TaxID=257277 RepID=A0ABW6P9S0_9NOCA